MPHTSDSPAKKQSKWSPEEDALIIELRGSGMKWDDISKRLPGRSAISCRLHYQNYLERRSEWDEERKNKLARLYERFKPEMWAKVAEEMQVPWRAAEAMHWQLGETDMARRAGVIPFSLSSAGSSGTDVPPQQHRASPSRGHSHSQSQGSLPRDVTGMPSLLYGRGPGPGGHPGPSYGGPPGHLSGSGRGMGSRREGAPHRPYGPPDPAEMGYGPPSGLGPGLAPIQTGMHGRGMLPSVAELTTGISPYSTPAYSTGLPSASPAASATASPGPMLPSMSGYGQLEPIVPKRRASPQTEPRETSRRRHLDPPDPDLSRRGP